MLKVSIRMEKKEVTLHVVNMDVGARRAGLTGGLATSRPLKEHKWHNRATTGSDEGLQNSIYLFNLWMYNIPILIFLLILYILFTLLGTHTHKLYLIQLLGVFHHPFCKQCKVKPSLKTYWSVSETPVCLRWCEQQKKILATLTLKKKPIASVSIQPELASSVVSSEFASAQCHCVSWYVY